MIRASQKLEQNLYGVQYQQCLRRGLKAKLVGDPTTYPPPSQPIPHLSINHSIFRTFDNDRLTISNIMYVVEITEIASLVAACPDL